MQECNRGERDGDGSGGREREWVSEGETEKEIIEFGTEQMWQ